MIPRLIHETNKKLTAKSEFVCPVFNHLNIKRLSYSGLLWQFWPKSAIFFPVNNFPAIVKPPTQLFGFLLIHVASPFNALAPVGRSARFACAKLKGQATCSNVSGSMVHDTLPVAFSNSMFNKQ